MLSPLTAILPFFRGNTGEGVYPLRDDKSITWKTKLMLKIEQNEKKKKKKK